MADSKDGVLPLVGRVIKNRLGEFKRETKEELSEGYGEFKRELEAELSGEDAEPGDEASSNSKNGQGAPKVRVEGA